MIDQQVNGQERRVTDFLQERDASEGDSHLEAPFLRVGNGPLDSRDIENCFTVFLGQKPTYDLVRDTIGSGIFDVIRDLLGSPEFLKSVLPPLLLREELPHHLLDTYPSLSLVDWAQRRLPIRESTRIAIGGARTWAQLLEVLLADPTLTSLSPELIAVNIQPILTDRLEKEPVFKVRRSVIGVVDSSSAFEVRGWAVDTYDKSTPVLLEFYADDVFIGSAVCNQSRPDVADVIGGNGSCGFTFKVSLAHRTSFEGGRTLTVVDSISRVLIGQSFIVHSDAAQSSDVIVETRKELSELRKVLDRIESRLPDISHRASIPLEAYSEYWERFYRTSPARLCEERSRSKEFAFRPLISVVIPTWKSNTRLLSKAIESARVQSYDHWELVLSDDASDSDELRSLLRRYEGDSRIHSIESSSRTGIAMNTNRGIQATTGDYVAFLDHDDELAPDAFYQVVLRLQDQRYGLVYSDEDRIEEDECGRCVHHTPFFKPDYDSDLLLAMNYICHLVVLRRDILTAVGGLRPGFEGAQDHDLLLRTMEQISGAEVLHLPRVLYHWRVTPGSVSQSSGLADAIQQNIVAAVDHHLKRRGVQARVEPHQDAIGSPRQFATRVRWLLPSPSPDLSIVVATRDRLELLRPCIQSVVGSLEKYPGKAEVVIVDNDSADPDVSEYLAGLSIYPQVRVVRFRGPFNYSAINNAGAREASGEVLIFLNNDTVVLTADWCVELVASAMRPGVGAVGARLLYADGTIQHAGVILGIEGVAGHECVGQSPQTGGYFGRSQLLRGTAAVTGACLATRKQLFLEMDGLDELSLKVAFNDVDYCMKLREAGYRVLYNPFAVLYHLESKSRGREITQAQQQRHRSEALAFRERWGQAELIDPYYNLHFERYARPFERLRPPPESGSIRER